ncbi:NAD(P)H-hydrate dehydratase [Acetobacteraceae bacterium H6797]|nr:NAD(P)H-hydrate dehydratase [Acetobacteraceae bacterium H6797]
MTDALALLTPAEMGEADRLAALAGAPGPQLMEAAGRAVARAIRRRWRPCPVLVLAGPGNNGGDGYVLARLLEREGWPVSIAALAPPRAGSDAALMAARWHGPMRPFAPAEAARAGLVVDALFGAGLTRPLAPEAAAVLAAAQGPVVAVDVPSGLDGGNGAPLGAVRAADLTVTFFRRKPGHLLMPGRALCGEVVCADIGLPASVLETIAPRTWANAPGLWRLPSPGAADHKYTRGHVTVLGSAAMPGAARLAAGAARRAGAGLVTLLADEAAVFRMGEPGLIVEEGSLDAALRDERRQTFLLGPGLPADEETRAALARLLAAGRQVVADAGALTACAGQPGALKGASIVTPHAGEFARVFGPIGQDRLAAARAAAEAIGGVVLLKGPDTVIAAPDGRAAINENAPPSLATAGSGDVLAGLAAGLLASGMAPFEAAAAAAWLHGQAARSLPAHGLIAEDLLQALPGALGEAASAQR